MIHTKNEKNLPSFECTPIERRTTTAWFPVMVMLSMLFIEGMAYFMSLAPQTRLLEKLVCDRHYSEAGRSFEGMLTEEACKIPSVQNTIAMLFGFQAFFDGIPGLLLAMPYGVLADQIGRKRILALSMLGQVLGGCWALFIYYTGLPLKLMWISSAFLIIGGGSTVSAAASLTIITDATTIENRSRVFMCGPVAMMAAEILGPPLGSFLMVKNLWAPLILSLFCTCLVMCLSLIIPETLTLDCSTRAVQSDEILKPLLPDDDGSTISSGSESPPSTLATTAWYYHCQQTLSFIMKSQNVLLLVLTFLISDFARQSMTILVQYVSVRFSLSLAKAGLILSFKATAQLIYFLLVLPLIDFCLIKKMSMPAKLKDLKLAKLSIILVTIAFIPLALAPQLWMLFIGLGFYTLGGGFSTFARSLVSSLVEPGMLATLYTALSLIDTIASLLAGPLVSAAFSLGSKLGGVWQGIPFLFACGLCTLASVFMLRVRLRLSDLDYQQVDTEDVENIPAKEEAHHDDDLETGTMADSSMLFLHDMYL